MPIKTSVARIVLVAAAYDLACAQNMRPVTKALHVAADGTGDFDSIQRAIDVAPASGGALILVAPGTYREVLTIDKPKIQLRSANPDASKTVAVFNRYASANGREHHLPERLPAGGQSVSGGFTGRCVACNWRSGSLPQRPPARSSGHALRGQHRMHGDEAIRARAGQHANTSRIAI